MERTHVLTKAPLQDDVVKELKLSKGIVGELLPVIVDQHGRIINGRHRTAAGWKKREVWPVKNDEEFALLRLHFLSAQRVASIAERAEAIAMLTEEIAKRVPAEQVVKTVLDKTPLNRTYTYELMPDRFKRSGGYERRSPEIRGSELEGPRVVDNVEVSPAPLPSERQGLIEFPCTHCGCPQDWRTAMFPQVVK